MEGKVESENKITSITMELVKRKKANNGIKIMILVGLSICVFILYGFSTTILPRNLSKMKCNDPSINKPMVSDNGWNVFLIVIGFVTLSITIFALGKKRKSADGFWYNCLVFLRPGLIFFIGFYATISFVEIMSKYLGYTAPNFIAACQPNNVNRLCNTFSSRYVIVNCTTPRDSWVPASSSFPSIMSTMQAFDMFFLVLYINYRIKSEANRWIHYVAGLTALIFTLATGCLTIYRNEVGNNGVWVGYLIGILSAITTMKILKWLEKEYQELPRFWNDPSTDEIEMTFMPRSDTKCPTSTATPKRTTQDDVKFPSPSAPAFHLPPPSYNSLFERSKNPPLDPTPSSFSNLRLALMDWPKIDFN